jgi:UDP-N-acetylmuramate: L-alanyl-gamma-D-glutamyl-meso-diaminopimelate ligase
VVQLLDTQGIEAHAADTNAALLEELTLATLQDRAKPRVVIFFSNGSFDGIIPRYVAAVTAAVV